MSTRPIEAVSCTEHIQVTPSYLTQHHQLISVGLNEWTSVRTSIALSVQKSRFVHFFLSLLSLSFISTILRKIRIEFNCAKNCVFRFVHSFDREGRPLRVLTASHNSIFQTIFCLKVRECARSRKFEVFRFHSVVC